MTQEAMAPGARKIDARGIWRGEAPALDQFGRAWAIDCGACSNIFARAYGWRPEAVEQAAGLAFPDYGAGPLLQDHP